MQCNTEKNALRMQMKEKRKSLSRAEIESKSRAICTAFAALEEFSAAKTVCVYMSAHGEVETSYIIEECKRQGKMVVVPVVEGDDIYLCRLTHHLEKGAYGISEPVEKITFPKEKVDIFAVPALAFDKLGGRVGFGKGYYDKLLHGASAIKAGLCYDFQLIDKIPMEEHDILMDYVISRSQTIYCRKDFQ